jgi:hypothetical protein
MALLHKMRKWLVAFCTIGTLCILLGCDTDFSEECGGVGDLVSCLSIDSIQPTDSSSGGNTSNVDAFRADCSDDPTAPEPEPFGDHNALITFSNQQFPRATGDTPPTVGGSLAVTILSYSVSYTLNHCPERATVCPALTGFTVSTGPTFTIPPDGTTTQTFTFVPLRVKEEYSAEGGELFGNLAGFPFPSYSANYVFNARTVDFEDDFQIVGSAEFTIGAFNNCGN